MEIAKLILEFIKALAWPLVTLVLVLKFRNVINGLLQAVTGRLASAETVKLGVLGQEVELSGTAKELRVERQQLLTAPGDGEARHRAGQLDQAISELNNPVADILGITVLQAGPAGLPLDDLVEHVVIAMGGETVLRGPQAAIMLSSVSREVDKMLARLQELDLVNLDRERYALSQKGAEFFGRVAARQKHLLQRLAAKPAMPGEAA